MGARRVNMQQFFWLFSFSEFLALVLLTASGHQSTRSLFTCMGRWESVRSSEVECRASRETVLRLVAELDRERKKAASSAAALDSLKVVLTQERVS